MKRIFNIRSGVALSLIGAGVAFLSIAGAALAQSNQPQMSVKAPSEEVKKNTDIKVDIVADNVKNLAAFQFSLSYDASILKYVSVEGGPFLGSSGREPQCPPADDDTAGTLQFNCVTLGPPPSVQGGKAGVDGSGVLATVTFAPVHGGTSALDLTEGRFIAAELDAGGMPVEIVTTVQGGSVVVASESGGIPMVVIGAVAGVVAAVVIVLLGFVLLRARASRRSL